MGILWQTITTSGVTTILAAAVVYATKGWWTARITGSVKLVYDKQLAEFSSELQKQLEELKANLQKKNALELDEARYARERATLTADARRNAEIKIFDKFNDLLSTKVVSDLVQWDFMEGGSVKKSIVAPFLDFCDTWDHPMYRFFDEALDSMLDDLRKVVHLLIVQCESGYGYPTVNHNDLLEQTDASPPWGDKFMIAMDKVSKDIGYAHSQFVRAAKHTLNV